MSKRTCVQVCKKKQKTKTIHQLSTYCTRAVSLLGKRDPSRVCLSSLGVECTPIQYTHTHTHAQSLRGMMQMPQWVTLTTLLTVHIGRLQQERLHPVSGVKGRRQK